MLPKLKEEEFEYIKWQNQATRFYISSRLLYANSLGNAMAFCAQQALESMLKATLVYWDKDFNPQKANHNFVLMLKALEEKVEVGKQVIIPNYFYHEGMYQSASRYPKGGIGIFNSFLTDLDKAFVDLVLLVPFQFNSILLHTLLPKTDERVNHFLILSKDNSEIERLRKHIFEAFGNSYYIRQYEDKRARNTL